MTLCFYLYNNEGFIDYAFLLFPPSSPPCDNQHPIW
jgi:hypothetical protein